MTSGVPTVLQKKHNDFMQVQNGKSCSANVESSGPVCLGIIPVIKLKVDTHHHFTE